MNLNRYPLLSTLIATLLLGSTSALAANQSCSAVLKQANEWPEGSPIHNLTLMKAMHPSVKQEIGGAGKYREVPRGLIKQIEQAQLDFFARECRDNPNLDSHNASKRALEKTRQAAIEYLEYRKK